MKKEDQKELIHERVARLERELSEAREELNRDILNRTNELLKVINSVSNSREHAEAIINLIRSKAGV